jgi:hypothetical protein
VVIRHETPRHEKPTVEDLGIDPDAQRWKRSGGDDEAIEVAFADGDGGRWVRMRLAGHPTAPVHVFNRHEWECFVDGAKRGEFDDAG